MTTRDDVTNLLAAWADGDRTALDALVPLLYGELRQAARRQLRRERPGHTLDTAALVHEAFLKLVRLDRIEWQGRAHFLALAARTMRHVLVDYAVRRNAEKRGGGQPPLPLEEVAVAAAGAPADLLTLDNALRRLEALDTRQAQIVECRFFGGMTVEETAEALGVSESTVKRDWTMSRAWLNYELSR